MYVSPVTHLFHLFGLICLSEGRLRTYGDLLPQCQEKSTKFLSTNNFRKAQEEIALSVNQGSKQSAPVPWAGVFYNTDWGANLYNISGVAVSYNVVFKVNSENIHNSLASHDYQHQLDPIDLRLDWKKHVKRYKSASLHELRAKQVAVHGPNSLLRSFTFVREPLEHFISGLVESYFRGLGFGPHPQLKGEKHMESFAKAVTANQVDMNMTIHIVNNLIYGQNHLFLKNNLKQWKHFYPQFFAIRKWQPEFVGYLDEFDEDWARMQSKLNVNIKYSSDMSHITQGDVFGFKKTLKRLFQEDHRYMRAMCHLLIRDYICLGFDLPVACADMYDTYGVDFNAMLASNSYNE